MNGSSLGYHHTNYALNGSMTSQSFGNTTSNRPFTDAFPFVFVNSDASGYIPPRATRISAMKEPTRLILVGDGVQMFSHDWKRFSARHGFGSLATRTANFVFLDGHASPVPATRLPTATDSMYGTDLNNDHGRWDIELVVFPIK